MPFHRTSGAFAPGAEQDAQAGSTRDERERHVEESYGVLAFDHFVPADGEDEEGDRSADEDLTPVVLGVVPDVDEIVEGHGNERQDDADNDADDVLGLRDEPTEKGHASSSGEGFSVPCRRDRKRRRTAPPVRSGLSIRCSTRATRWQKPRPTPLPD